jgi:hypothetical protein
LKYFYAILLSVWFFGCFGQFSYDYVRQPNSVSASIAGGSIVSGTAGDLGVWMDNPALLDSTVDNHAAIFINPYFSDIVRYGFGISRTFRSIDHVAVGLVYNGYGTFERFDATGNALGSFSGRSYILQIGAAHQVGLFDLGASIKYSGMLLEATSASLVLFDIGGVFRHPKKGLTIGMSFRNMGWAIAEASVFETSELPFDVVAGFSFKPEYMPFRFTFTAYDLPRSRVEVVPANLQRGGAFSPMLRFVNPSVALLLGDLLEFQVGYNYRINETLRLETGGFGAGWSFGFKMLLKKYQVMIARNTYQAAGGTTFITLQTNYKTIKSIF